MPSPNEAGAERHHVSRPCITTLARYYRMLKSTGRGKHVGPFSYYHLCLVQRAPGVAASLLCICDRLYRGGIGFNVVKLDARSRISFLSYECFTIPFPALLSAVSCDLSRDAARQTDYSNRRNPPILHRKELLLPADHPLVPDAERLTDRLEGLGAFDDTRRIGTRAGWNRRLASLGIDPAGRSP